MPPRRTAKAPRCEYKEKGRRCVRNGSGSPVLCRAHRLVLEEESRKMNERPPVGAAAADFISRFAAGRHVSAADFFNAMADAFEAVSGAMPADGVRPPPRAAPRGGFRREDPRWGGPPMGGRPHGHEPPPPPRPPEDRLAGARAVLGFPPTGTLTLEIVKKRRRELGRKHHPDMVPPARRAAATETMKSINAAADLIEKSLTS